MFSALVERLAKEPRQITVVKALSDVATFGSSDSPSDLYDLGNLFETFKIGGDISSCISSTASESRSGATGLSVYFPLSSSYFLDSYYELNRMEPYSEYLKAFLSFRAEETISLLSYDTDAIEQNEFSFFLTPESINYLWKAEYHLYSNESETYFHGLGWDNDVSISGNRITVLFEGNWVEFGGHPIYCEPKEQNGNVTVFKSMILVNGELATMLFSFDSETSEARIIGVTYRADNFNRIYEIPENAHIDLITIDCTVIRDDEGRSMQTSSLGFDAANGFDYTGDMNINVIRLPDGFYQYTAAVTDIYGKIFTAGTVNVEIRDSKTHIISVTTELTGMELGGGGM